MGKHAFYELNGWGRNGRFLAFYEKEELEDLLFDEGVDDWGRGKAITLMNCLIFL